MDTLPASTDEAVKDAAMPAPLTQGGQPVRCLIVTNHFPPSVGGAANVYAALATAAQGRIAVLAASRDYSTGLDLPGLGGHDDAVPYPLERIRDVRPSLHGTRGFHTRLSRAVEEAQIRRALWRRVRRIVAERDIRVLCVADDETVGWLIPRAQAQGLAVFVHVHGDDMAERPGRAARRIDARRRVQFARADAIVAVSEAAARDLERRFGVARSRVDVLPNGIDPALFRPQQPDPALLLRYGLSGRRAIVTVGRLVARKGIDTVIRALPAIAAAAPDIGYLIVGDGPERGALERLASATGVADRVVFAGEVAQPRVAAHMALAHVFAMPNRRMPDGEDEGFGLVFLEANAVGVPMLGGRDGGVPEVVRDEETGLLVDGADLAAVTGGVIRLIGDTALRGRLVEGGLREAATATWSNRVGAYLALCERIAGNVTSRKP